MSDKRSEEKQVLFNILEALAENDRLLDEQVAALERKVELMKRRVSALETCVRDQTGDQT